MPVFSNRSKANLEGCTPEVRVLCNEAIKVVDFAVTTGHRTDEEQEELYALGRTKPGRIVTYKKAGESVHNWNPSPAFDFAPWPIDWNDMVRFGVVAGVIKYIAWQKGIQITWGGDWETLKDYPHIQIRSTNA